MSTEAAGASKVPKNETEPDAVPETDGSGTAAEGGAAAEQASAADAGEEDAEFDLGPSGPPPRDHNDAPLRKLSVHLLDTYRHINRVYYADRQARKKAWDDKHDNYIIKSGEMFNDRFEFRSQVGKGSFGVVAYARDTEKNIDVAIKIIKSQRPFAKQAQTEIKLLQFMAERNKDQKHGIVRLLEHFRHRSHECLVFEMLDHNLYEVIKKTEFHGLTLKLVAHFAEQLLDALEFLRQPDIRIIHCDLKPENILLCPDIESSKIKIIDFGSSCFYDNKMYEYIQSRFYRSPEVILGLPYDEAIDMWSLGCILFELHAGFPLFGGQNEEQQMQYICALQGLPPPDMLAKAKPAKRAKMFVDSEDVPVPGDKRSVDGRRSEGEISAELKAKSSAEDGSNGSGSSSNGSGSGGSGEAAGGGVGNGADGSAAAITLGEVGPRPDSVLVPGGVDASGAELPARRYKLKHSRPPTTLAKKLRLEKGGLEQWREDSPEKAVEMYSTFIDLLEKMLTYSPEARIRPTEALQHHYILHPPGREQTIQAAGSKEGTNGAKKSSATEVRPQSEEEVEK